VAITYILLYFTFFSCLFPHQEFSFQLHQLLTMPSPHLVHQPLKPHPLAGRQLLPPRPPLLSRRRVTLLPRGASFLPASPPMSTEHSLPVRPLTRERKFTSISMLSSISYSLRTSSGTSTGRHTHCRGTAYINSGCILYPCVCR
jgi:hypothetical protein